MSTYHKILAATVLILLPLCWGCTSPPSEPGHRTKQGANGQNQGDIFRHRWWNYYQRALSSTEGRHFEYAVSDLKEALEQRERDQRMARTYGMHFIDYFPNREMGLLYYEIGDMEAAERYLTRSIEQYPSAKAYFFLDQVRRESLRKSGMQVSPPYITMKAYQDRIITRDDPVLIKGTAKDAAYVQAVFIDGRPIYMDGSKKEFPFTAQLPLVQGEHSIKVHAVNLAGKAAHRTITVLVDRQGPMISLKHIKQVKVGQRGTFEIEGLVADRTPLESVRVNSEKLKFETGKQFAFHHTLQPGIGTLHIEAMDRLGNRTEATLSLNDLAGTSSSALVAASDLSVLTGLLKPKDGLAPRISLKGWSDTETVFLDKVYIDGVVTDQNAIAGIHLNGEPVPTMQGRIVFFNQVVPLKEGVNTLKILAEDKFGNRSEKSVRIIRRIPEAFQLSARLKLTVFPFEQENLIRAPAGQFQDYLIDALIRQERFRVVERNLLDLILQEHRLSASKLVDRSTALNVGRLAAAQSLVAGRIIETRHGVEVISRMIDTETSDILATVDVFGEQTSPDALSALAGGMAMKYHRDFPLSNGMVLQSDRDMILTDLGREEIKLQRRVIVYTEKPVLHPRNNRTLGMEKQIVCQARVTQVLEQASKARILDEPKPSVQELFKVVAQ